MLEEDLPLLKESSPKLEKLLFSLDCMPEVVERGAHQAGDYVYNIVTALNGLQIFSDTLRELDLLDDAFTHPGAAAAFKGNLPKLEKLTLKYSPMNKIDFLFDFKTLKYLEIKSSPMDDSKTGEFALEVFERMPNVETVVVLKSDLQNPEQQRLVYRRQS